ncbi:succinate dehydrogenase assembly factor 2 [Tistrella sp. BH-R2-4]|jgi:antitoxin CptB|uniref:FAD assembly factor SdhE n=1 Tax=Tistrella arctica TaxID=3133430 RepID=A0ABU9YF14_9PROT
MAEDTDARRRRLRYQSWYRGCKETDILFGKFADVWLDRFDAAGLDAFEALLNENDIDLYNWLSGREPVPADLAENPVMVLMMEFDFAAAPDRGMGQTRAATDLA